MLPSPLASVVPLPFVLVIPGQDREQMLPKFAPSQRWAEVADCTRFLSGCPRETSCKWSGHPGPHPLTPQTQGPGPCMSTQLPSIPLPCLTSCRGLGLHKIWGKSRKCLEEGAFQSYIHRHVRKTADAAEENAKHLKKTPTNSSIFHKCSLSRMAPK